MAKSVLIKAEFGRLFQEFIAQQAGRQGRGAKGRRRREKGVLVDVFRHAKVDNNNCCGLQVLQRCCK